ncbi:acyl-CoA N-acyltransferase [Striga asiatica]|uniref:Acyl-CoA N-acyltransferase n=1 Tax=Striga asiatica TaxID=4170 RepID=A0A5A7PQM2_STRAF|nr:acyl-CoA N-acyltransferase [Striga asiatica]
MRVRLIFMTRVRPHLFLMSRHCPNFVCKFYGDASGMYAQGNDGVADELTRCNFCGKKTHTSCSVEVHDLPMSSHDGSFRGLKCHELYGHQQNLGVKHELEDGFSWSFIQQIDVSDNTHRIPKKDKLQQTIYFGSLNCGDEFALDSRTNHFREGKNDGDEIALAFLDKHGAEAGILTTKLNELTWKWEKVLFSSWPGAAVKWARGQ